MRFTTIATSKGQITIPKHVRGKINLKPGVKIDTYPTADGFVGRLHKPSKIFDFLGDFKELPSSSLEPTASTKSPVIPPTECPPDPAGAY
jgi:AbrB family looped-hinge helix DNA binding protein